MNLSELYDFAHEHDVTITIRCNPLDFSVDISMNSADGYSWAESIEADDYVNLIDAKDAFESIYSYLKNVRKAFE